MWEVLVKDYKNSGKWKELTLDGVELVRRFLMHIPPRRFVRIRHYGLLSNQNKRRLIPICRNLIGCREFLCRFKKDDKAQAIRVALRLFLVFLLFSPVFPVASPVYLEELLSFLVSPQSFSLSWCPPGFSQLFSVLWCPLFLSPDLLKASPVIFEASYNFYCYVRCFHSCSKLPML